MQVAQGNLHGQAALSHVEATRVVLNPTRSPTNSESPVHSCCCFTFSAFWT